MQKLAEICIKRPVFATMLIMALVVMGLASYRKLGVDFFPKVEFPIVQITKLVDDRVKKSIESLNGVGQVRFVGERRRQVQVWLDGEKLYSYNLNIDQVRAALAAQNVEVPGGRLEQGSREVSLRTLGR